MPTGFTTRNIPNEYPVPSTGGSAPAGVDPGYWATYLDNRPSYYTPTQGSPNSMNLERMGPAGRGGGIVPSQVNIGDLSGSRYASTAALRPQAQQPRTIGMAEPQRPNEQLPTYNEPGFDAGGQAAAFNRAKDTIAQTSRASLEALRDEMAGRGIASSPGAPSGIQEAGEAAVINRGQGALGDVIRQQAIERSNFEAGRGQRIAQKNYEAEMARYQQALQIYMAQLANWGRMGGRMPIE